MAAADLEEKALRQVQEGPLMPALDELDWNDVRAHYDHRVDVHNRLLKLHRGGLTEPFAKLLLGISDPAGNFSANQHGLGPKILQTNANAEHRVYQLASALIAVTKPREVPPLIRSAALSYLAIGVGSEASCLLNPTVCWVANTRTIWTHLVVKHADDFAKADEELKLYRDADSSSEMAYAIWRQIHGLLETSMTRIAKEGARRATQDGVTPGSITYLWADAIADALYVWRHG